MITTDTPNEKIVTIDTIGQFNTPNGKYTVLTIVIKQLRNGETKQ